MPIYTFKTQRSIGDSIAATTTIDAYSLDISSVNANRVTSYEIKVLIKDTSSNEYSIGYFRGQVVNNNGVTPTSYSTNKDTSFIYTSSTAANIYLSNTITDIYDIAAQSFEIKLTNSSGASKIFTGIISIEINFKI